MLSLFGKNQQPSANFDSTELLWQFQSSPEEFTRAYLELRDPYRRSAILEITSEYSISFLANLLISTNGNVSKKNQLAFNQVISQNEMTRDFADFLIACGLLHDDQISEASTAKYKRILKYLFEHRVRDNSHHDFKDSQGQKAVYRFNPEYNDQDNLLDARLAIDSFEHNSRTLSDYAHSFRDRRKTYSDKIISAASLYLHLKADQEIRAEIRANDISSWIDIYDPTEIDRELIEAWLRHCDPIMRAGYFATLSQEMNDPSDRGTRAKLVVDMLESSLSEDRLFDQNNLGQQAINELELIGVYPKITAEFLQNSISQQCPGINQKFDSYLELKNDLEKRLSIIIDIIFKGAEILIYPPALDAPVALAADEVSLVHSLSKQCLCETDARFNNEFLSRGALAYALRIADKESRKNALELIDQPNLVNFVKFTKSSDGVHGDAIVAQLLMSPLHQEAYQWLDARAKEAYPFLTLRFKQLGLRDEINATATLSLIAKARVVDPEFSKVLARSYHHESRAYIKQQLLRALAHSQDPSAKQNYLDIFKDATHSSLLDVEAIRALALSGPNGLQYLGTCLSRQRARFSHGVHESNFISITPTQQIILNALPLAQQDGARVLRTFVKNFPRASATKFVVDFMRSANLVYFGLSESEIWKRFDEYCGPEEKPKRFRW